jgi:hypothetical protein
MRRSTRPEPNDPIRNRVIRTAVVVGLVGAGCQAADDDAVDTDTTIEVPMPDSTSGSTPPNTSSPDTSSPDTSSPDTSSPDTSATTSSGDDSSMPDDTAASSLPIDVITTEPDRPTTTPPAGATGTVYEIGMIDAGLAPFVAIAVDDLAARLDVQTDSIDVLTAVLVVWPNGALGCPEPGRSYTQVMTDGSVIELGVDGVVYRYHSGGSLAPFPCDRPLDPVPAPA